MNGNEKNKKENNKINRRQFCIAVGNTAAGLAVLGSIGITYDYLSPNVVLEVPQKFTVGPVSAIQPNTVIFNPEYRVFIFRDKAGFFYALSAVCPHLGCTTVWKNEGTVASPEGAIACPCHGSIFSKRGNVIQGPATRDLDRFRSFIQDGQLVVDVGEKVSEEEMILKV